MRFEPIDMPGLWLLELEPIHDDRGYFTRSWCRRELEEHGLCGQFVQGNISYNRREGTLRGMHWQAEPHGEIKLVRAVRGGIFDVVVDVRPDSPTYRQWRGFEFRADDFRVLYIPHGIAHGFQTLTDDAQVQYEMSTPYHPASARGARWNDPAFGIDWPACDGRIISDRDAAFPDFPG
jgi:dTDP-4-dehydrorhamnose 3,5-epimerase